MNLSAAPPPGACLCSRCGRGSPDLRLVGCSCLLHAKCAPLSLIVNKGAPYQYGGIPTPVKERQVCPICKTGTLQGIQLLAMGFEDLEKAMELRRDVSHLETQKVAMQPCGGKRSREDATNLLIQQIQAESTYLLLSHARTLPGIRDSQKNHRTGRWSREEVSFVDHLVAAFDQGSLNLPHGVKLNEFLGDMLLCKSSRLTKKMKNAKLSTRSFTLQNIFADLTDEECVALSMDEDRFVQSIPIDYLQLELKFNMTKLWRTHFSNLCVQVGYDLLDAREWIASLEQMEKRASDAEDVIRKARRRRMGQALRQDVGLAANEGIFIGGVPACGASLKAPVVASAVQQAPTGRELTTILGEEDAVDFLDSVLEFGGNNVHPVARPRSMSGDFSFGISEDLIDSLSTSQVDNIGVGDCGPFLDKVISYMEHHNVPFEHVDVWVPSFLPPSEAGSSQPGGEKSLRLFHAGHATRHDVRSTTAAQLNEYGFYSANFSFAPGCGLPGRVYSNGKSSWECKVHNADPSKFERAGGAKVNGVQTAVGIPLDTSAVGRIILSLYSTQEVPRDDALVERLTGDFVSWTPEPKWKLVIELGDSPNAGSSSSENGAKSGSMGVDHVISNKTAVAPEKATSCGTLALSQDTNSTASLTNSWKPIASSSDVFNQTAVSAPGSCLQGKVDSANGSTSSTLTPPVDDDVDFRIASLLGDHMPLKPTEELYHCMSLRLSLLRAPNKRTPEESDMLVVVKKSYYGYSKDNKRSDSELALLLSKDWMYLSSPSAAPHGASSSPVLQNMTPPLLHQCHVMAPAAKVQTMTATGIPSSMPSSLLAPKGPPQQQHQHCASGTGERLVLNRHHPSERTTTPDSDTVMERRVAEGSREVSATVVPPET